MAWLAAGSISKARERAQASLKSGMSDNSYSESAGRNPTGAPGLLRYCFLAPAAPSVHEAHTPKPEPFASM